MGLLDVFRRGPSPQTTIAQQQEVIHKLVRATFDSAQTTDLNRRHWAAADGLSPNAALTPEVRQRLRNRGRYEVGNNCYAAGIASTWARDMVGTGPRLQLDLGPDVDLSGIRRLETAFFDWCDEIDLARKLRLAKLAKISAGEVFGIKTTNRRLRSGVQLDVKLIEADQITAPWNTFTGPDLDGLQVDEDGNVTGYYVAKTHPGDTLGWGALDGEWVDAKHVLHWFHATRPGQLRGVPEITPALELFALLRRYTLAVVTAAETAANVSFILKTNMPAESGGPAQLSTYETMPWARGMGIAAPEGWDPVQMKAEHPVSTHDQFVRRLLNEIARALDMPYIVAAMDSSSANYSSMRGDYLVYRKAIAVERNDVERVWLDPLFYAWLDEAIDVPGLIPRGLPPFQDWNWTWTWDGFEHVDPRKEAEADALMVEKNMASAAEVCAKRGRDWRVVYRQRAAEKALARELQIDEPVAEVAEPVAQDTEDDDE